MSEFDRHSIPDEACLVRLCLELKINREGKNIAW